MFNLTNAIFQKHGTVPLRAWRIHLGGKSAKQYASKYKYEVAGRVVRGWPNPDFVAETREAFPGRNVADVEEARVLFSAANYVFLDVRSTIEVDNVGKVRGSVNIPLVNAKRVYDSKLNKKVVVEEPNHEWVTEVQKRFPRKQTAFLVAAGSAGQGKAAQAVAALQGAGYTDVVEIRGGFDAWINVFDFKLNRRKSPPSPIPSSQSGVSSAAVGSSQYASLEVSSKSPFQEASRTTSSASGASGLWPDREFVAATLAAFPAKSVANIEEARALISNGGYTYLDVRTELECEEFGKVQGSVHIPWVNARRAYDALAGKKVVVSEPNQDWLRQVQRRFPDRSTPLLVACTNGTQFSLDALATLDDAGYTSIVGLSGGHYNWSKVFDSKLNRRRTSQPGSSQGDPSTSHSAAPPPGPAPSAWRAAGPREAPPSAGVPSGVGQVGINDAVTAAREALERALEWTVLSPSLEGSETDQVGEAAKGSSWEGSGTGGAPSREWPDPDFISETKAAFPAKAVCDVEEARVLFSNAKYIMLDIRTEGDIEESGRVRGSVHLPMVHTRRVYDPKANKKVYVKEPNSEWLATIQKRFPDPGTPLLVVCTDGKKYSIDALTMLEDSGYRCLVGLKGGYSAWSQVFDQKLNRRLSDSGAVAWSSS